MNHRGFQANFLVKTGLQHADFFTRREMIRTLVKRVEVDEKHIRVIFRVSPTWSPSSSEDTSHNWQHYGRRVHACAFHGDYGHSQFLQPIVQSQQVTGHGRKGTCFASRRCPLACVIMMVVTAVF